MADQWHPTLNHLSDATDVLRTSRINAWWLCRQGHSWQQVVAARIRRGTSCPVCCNRLVLAGYNDLGTTHPHLAAQWHPERNGTMTPTTVTAGSQRRIWWRCDRGHEWDAVCYSRTSGNQNGCPVCGNKRVLAGYNDLATTHPSLAAEWHPERNGAVSPDQVIAGSHHRAWWRCRLGHEWQSIINSRRDGSRTCPICSGAQVLAGYNDLATTHPAIAAQWHHHRNGNLSPERTAPGSGAAIWWCCDIGHEWRTTPASRTGPVSSGCPYCANKAVLPGYNDLATTHPDLARQWHPTRNGKSTPTDIAAGTRKAVWWLCERGHEWPASGSNRARLGVGCPDCAPGGFRPNSPGSVYVVTNGTAHKIGVMGTDHKRLHVHRGAGWHKAKVWRFALGRDAYSVEQEVIRRLRAELGLIAAYLPEEMRQGGATETVAAVDLPLTAMCSLVEDTVVRLGLNPLVDGWEQTTLPV
nr:zinc-ribbon domain-containing protein [Georgenia yuyongxinii]